MDIYNKNGSPVVFVDADNTLWDTDGVFASAQLRVLLSVENILNRKVQGMDRLEFVRKIDQAMAELHHLGLRYPPSLLIYGVALALNGEEPESAASLVWKGSRPNELISIEQLKDIEVTFIADIQRLPKILPGVKMGLENLVASGFNILVLTEGHRNRVLKTATELGIVNLIVRIIEAPKVTRLYERVLRLVGNPKYAFMIGDQLKRDIAPAKSAGLTTIYIPGGFRPKWEFEQDLIKPDYVASRFDEGVEAILNRCP